MIKYQIWLELIFLNLQDVIHTTVAYFKVCKTLENHYKSYNIRTSVFKFEPYSILDYVIRYSYSEFLFYNTRESKKKLLASLITFLCRCPFHLAAYLIRAPNSLKRKFSSALTPSIIFLAFNTRHVEKLVTNFACPVLE